MSGYTYGKLDETQFSAHRTKSVSQVFSARARYRNSSLMKRIGGREHQFVQYNVRVHRLQFMHFNGEASRGRAFLRLAREKGVKAENAVYSSSHRRRIMCTLIELMLLDDDNVMPLRSLTCTWRIVHHVVDNNVWQSPTFFE